MTDLCFVWISDGCGLWLLTHLCNSSSRGNILSDRHSVLFIIKHRNIVIDIQDVDYDISWGALLPWTSLSSNNLLKYLSVSLSGVANLLWIQTSWFSQHPASYCSSLRWRTFQTVEWLVEISRIVHVSSGYHWQVWWVTSKTSSWPWMLSSRTPFWPWRVKRHQLFNSVTFLFNNRQTWNVQIEAAKLMTY